MWVFNRDRFFSVAKKPGQDKRNELTIRSRFRMDIVRLERFVFRKTKIHVRILKDAGTDYQYRVVLPATVWADYMAKTSMDINYSNFKSAISAKNHERAEIYLEVWSTMISASYRNQRRRYPFFSKPYGADDCFDEGGVYQGEDRRA
jgi:hypothetical protein